MGYLNNSNPNTLHITSGECSAYALRQLLPKADIVAFSEAMCEGACCGVVGSVDFKQLRSLAYNVNMNTLTNLLGIVLMVYKCYAL